MNKISFLLFVCLAPILVILLLVWSARMEQTPQTADYYSPGNVHAPVPEPSTFILMASALIGVTIYAIVRHRHKK